MRSIQSVPYLAIFKSPVGWAFYSLAIKIGSTAYWKFLRSSSHLATGTGATVSIAKGEGH